MKKIMAILTAMFLMVVSANVSASDIRNKGVTDYSGVVSDYVKNYVKERNEILFEKVGAKIIFVVTDHTNGVDIADYTNELYASDPMSSEGRKNSFLIVVDVKGKEYSFVKGKNLKFAFPDTDVYKVLVDKFEPYFSKDSYDSAIVSLYNSLGRWYEQNYNDLDLKLDDNYSNYMYGIREKDAHPDPDNMWIWITLGTILSVAIIWLWIKRRLALKRRKYERRKLKEKRRKDIDKIINS